MFPPLASYATLARWLGPWASEDQSPRHVSRRTETVAAGDRSFEAWVYRPSRARIRGAVLVSPGLHYAGPQDPRMERFCRILASSGTLVFAPFIRDYTDLRVVPRALDDLDHAFVALLGQPDLPPGCKPIVFSISFGSLLALRLASSAERAHQVGGLLLFGGYADWADTLRFSLTGEIDGVPHLAHDPLNQPVVFLNLLSTMKGTPDDPAPLAAAWREFCESTWGRQEYKRGDKHHEVARLIAPRLPEELRELFLRGCGALPGGYDMCMDALTRATETSRFLDPLPYVDGLRCPVHIVHGMDDDVIPYVQMERLARALPGHVPCETYLTGLYGHTSQASLAELIGNVPTLAKELWTMGRILRAFVKTPRG